MESNKLPYPLNVENRQCPEYAIFDITAAMFARGGGKVVLEAQPGSVLIDGRVRVIDLFDAGTNDQMNIGTDDDDNRYTGTPINLKANSAGVDLTLDDYVFGAAPNTNKIVISRTTTGTEPTNVGKVRVILGFVRYGKAYHTQGNASAATIPPNPGPNY